MFLLIHLDISLLKIVLCFFFVSSICNFYKSVKLTSCIVVLLHYFSQIVIFKFKYLNTFVFDVLLVVSNKYVCLYMMMI